MFIACFHAFIRAKRHVCAILPLWLVISCSESSEESGYLPPQLKESRLYIHEVRNILQQLRSLDVDVGKVVGSTESVRSSAIVPAIETQFLPTINELFRQLATLTPPTPLQQTHDLLAKYLALRQEAYNAAVAGHRERNAQLLKEFASLQTEADVVGRNLEDELRRIRKHYPF